MYNEYRILGLIPARGGSKGIKNKNIINLNGKPLISYSINASLESSYIDKTLVTTDSELIAEISRECGADVPFLRPPELASDTSKTIDAVIHATDILNKSGDEYDIVVLLQPTQPLRSALDIDRAIEYFFEKGMKGLTSVSPVEDPPILIRRIDDNGNLIKLLDQNSTRRRQDMDNFYRVNGCIYINRIDELTPDTSLNDNPIGYIMDISHSVDIDDMKDLYLAEYYVKENN